jgi:putative holliday junction resolvase
MILGVDPGRSRVGLAVADAETRFARPLEVIETAKADPAERIARLVEELDVATVVVGRPVSLSGRPGPAVRAQASFVAELRRRLQVPVEEFDERLTSVVAERSLRAAGAPARARRRARDAVAAQVMLQGYLDSRR